MDREYDVFERLPNGEVEWHGFVSGLEAAHTRLEVLAKQSKNQFFAQNGTTGEIVASINAKNEPK